MSATPQSPALPRTAVRIGLALSLLLLVAAAAAFTYATRVAQKGRHETASATPVAITGKSCEPNELTVAAGRHVFRIENRSDRAVEWEILDGVMVLEERENIAPGFTQTLATRLEPGDYAITCGLLSNPRGKLHVLPAANAGAMQKPDLAAFIGGARRIQGVPGDRERCLVQAADAFAGAVKSRRSGRGKGAVSAGRDRLCASGAGVAAVFGLDAAIDGRADGVRPARGRSGFRRPASPGIRAVQPGQHRRPRTRRRRAGERRGIAQDPHPRSAHHAGEHGQRIGCNPGAACRRRAGFGDSPYAHGDLTSFEAAETGVRKVFDLLRPVAIKTAPDIVSALDRDFAVLGDMIAMRRAEASDALSDPAKTELGKAATVLAGDLTRLRETMDLSQ